MAISVSAPFQEYLPVESPGIDPAALHQFPQSPSVIDSKLGFLNLWDSTNTPTTPRHHFPLRNEPISYPGSPISTGSFSPVFVKEERMYSYNTPPRPRNTSTSPLKRKSDEYGDGSDNTLVPLPGFQSLRPCHKSRGRSCITSPLWAPSITPELSEGDVYSGYPILPFVQDPITEGLNRARIEQNKEPLPPLEALCLNPRFNIQTTQLIPLQHVCSEPSQQSPPLPEAGKRCVKAPKAAHCNIKYLLEELDFIRYKRVDSGLKWAVVQSSFRAKFPATVFPLPREKQGLQGVCYRQNKLLPRIHNGQLVFMLNGHVEPICIKTREQTEKKHMYTLVYLFPDRAMNYHWVSLSDRERARELNEKRQRQIERARHKAMERGTYIEKLPSEVPCGCCPGEDRERDPGKRIVCKPSRVKDEAHRRSRRKRRI